MLGLVFEGAGGGGEKRNLGILSQRDTWRNRSPAMCSDLRGNSIADIHARIALSRLTISSDFRLSLRQAYKIAEYVAGSTQHNVFLLHSCKIQVLIHCLVIFLHVCFQEMAGT